MEDNTAPDTSNFLDWVEIKNFKSIKDLRLDCKRVNIFIGKPNVGKSNILEALGMLGASFYNTRFMGNGVRYRSMKHLYYQNDVTDTIGLISNKYSLFFSIDIDKKGEYFYSLQNRSSSKSSNLSIEDIYNDIANQILFLRTNSSGNIIEDVSIKKLRDTSNLIKVIKYDFENISDFEDSLTDFLLPNGKNLFGIVLRSSDLKNEFGKLFLEQGLDFVLDLEEYSLGVQRKDGFYVNNYGYFSIADTFRRFMFYIAAIESNKNSVLILEEPEVHSFPPYTQEMAYRMIYDTGNQYFISTHSPYMLHPFIEKMDYKDLNVFVTYYEDYQTHVKALDYEEFRDILDYSTNIFFNLDRFTPNATNKVAS